MPKFVYEMADNTVRTRKIRGSGREAAMRAAAAAPKGTVLIGKAKKTKVLIGSVMTDGFQRVASPTKSIVCIRSDKTGTVTCVDRPTARRAQRAEKLLQIAYGLGTGEKLPKNYRRLISARQRSVAGPPTSRGVFPRRMPRPAEGPPTEAGIYPTPMFPESPAPSGFARMNPGGYGRMSPMARRRRSFSF